uniref:Mediator of RNA polymerase II transcription subunit 25 n=1 Tax=Scylla olivacea TaxID=85551 RepID=A0A0P4VVX5_SCYOL
MNFDRTDIVFVVEKSVSMKTYLAELLESYITPIISLFGGGLSEESDVIFTQSSMVQYASVFYGTELSLMGGWGQVECFGPTCSETEILNSIRNARYTGRNLTRQAFIMDGLQAALNMFEAMKQRSPAGENVQRCCILVTQSISMSNPWSPTNLEKVILDIKRNKIQLSVVSAHKLVELYCLFNAAGGDHQSTLNKNYASKPQHLVLLQGFSLQERAVSPSLIPYCQTTPVATPPAAPPAHMAPSVNVPTQAGPGPSPNPLGPGATTPSPGPVVTVGSPAPPQPPHMVRPGAVNPMVVNPSQTCGPQVPVVRSIMPRMINPPRPRWPTDNVTGSTNTPPMNTWIAPNPRPQVISSMMLNQQPQPPVPTDGMGPKPQQQQPTSMPNVDGSMINSNIQGQNPQQAQMSVGPTGVNPTMNPPNQRSVVWQGTLEWQEKKPDNNSRVVHQVTCKMTSMMVDGEPEVKADHWATTLIMQMIPKHILGSIGNTFFRNVKTVMFLPDQSHALEILTNFLFRGMAGCVHVSHPSPHPSPHQQSDVKVIILLYSSEKKAYVGFVPIDQLSFVNKIKSVIQNARKSQTTNMMAPGTGPTTSHMGVPGNAGLQQLPSTAAGSGMNVIPTQSMIIHNNPQLTQALSQPLNQGGTNLLGTNQMSQIPGSGVTQGPGVNVQMAPGQSVLATQLTTRPPLNLQQQPQQQQQQQQTEMLQMRQNPQQQPQQQQHHTLRQQVHQQRPSLTMSLGQQGPGGTAALGQPRMMQPMQGTGLKQLLQQQQQHVRLQHQQQQVQQQQQQQQWQSLWVS